MLKVVTYLCEYCGKQFVESPEACKQHERDCNKCNHCKHAYYVYGCEFACKYNDEGKCGNNNNYPHFEQK